MLEFMDTSFGTPEELEEKLKMPVLVSMPIRYTEMELKTIRRKKVLAAVSVGIGFIAASFGVVLAAKGVEATTNYINLFDQYGEGVGFSAKYKIFPRIHIKHQPNIDDLGSAHSLGLNLEYYDIRDPVLVVQGDNLFKFDIADFAQKHREKGAIMSIALVTVEDTRQYGVAELDKKGRIHKFIEINML